MLLTLTGVYQKEKVKVTFGLNLKNKDYYGIMMYHRNRLIKAYEKVGCQLKVRGEGLFCMSSWITGAALCSVFSLCFSIPSRLQVKGRESGSSVSSSVTFWNLPTTSKTLNTPKNTGTTHTHTKQTQPRHTQEVFAVELTSCFAWCSPYSREILLHTMFTKRKRSTNDSCSSSWKCFNFLTAGKLIMITVS